MAYSQRRRVVLEEAGEGPIRLPPLLCSLFLLACFAAISVLVLSQPYTAFDVALERAVQAVSWGPLLASFWWADWLEGYKQVAAAGLGILLVFLFRRRATPLMLWGLLSGAAYQLLEAAVQRPRPEAGLVQVVRHTQGYAFPSGHAVFFTWFAAYLLLVFGRGLPKPLQVTSWALYALFLVAVALGRIYTAEHWPTDVIAGLCLGGGWALLGLSIRRLSDPVLGDG